MKKLLSLFLAVLMLISVLPVMALAEELTEEPVVTEEPAVEEAAEEEAEEVPEEVAEEATEEALEEVPEDGTVEVLPDLLAAGGAAVVGGGAAAGGGAVVIGGKTDDEMLPASGALAEKEAIFTVKPLKELVAVKDGGETDVEFGVYLRTSDGTPVEACSFNLILSEGLRIRAKKSLCNGELSIPDATGMGHPYQLIAYNNNGEVGKNFHYFAMAGFDGGATPNYNEDVLLFTFKGWVEKAGEYTLDIVRNKNLVAGNGDAPEGVTQMFQRTVVPGTVTAVALGVTTDAEENKIVPNEDKTFSVTLSDWAEGNKGGLKYNPAVLKYLDGEDTTGMLEFDKAPVTVNFEVIGNGATITPCEVFANYDNMVVEGDPIAVVVDDPDIQTAKAVLGSVVYVIPASKDGFSKDNVYVSPDGKDVYSEFKWVTQAGVDALQKAVNTALAKQVSGVLAAGDAATLNKAVETFNKACKPGSRVDCKSFELQVSKVAQEMTEDAPYELAAGKSVTFAIVQDPVKTTEAFTLSNTEDGDFTAKISGVNVTVTANKDAKAGAIGHFTVTSTSGKTQEIYAKVIVPTTGIKIENDQNSKAPVLTYNGAVTSITLTADVTPADHTDTIKWSITKGGEFATLDTTTGDSCTVTATAAGSVTVQAEASGKKATVTIKIGAAADTVTTTAKSRNVPLLVNKSTTLKATAVIDGSKEKPISANVVWSSSDESVAEVDAKGKVTAKGIGECTITATPEAHVSDYDTANDVVFNVTVTPELKSFSLMDENNKKISTLSAVVGKGTIDLSEYVAIEWKDGNDHPDFENVTYKVDKEAVGTVDEAGEFTPAAAGTAKVTVTMPATGKTATVTVKVGQGADKVTTTAKSRDVSLLAGKSTTLKATAAIADSKEKPISANVEWKVDKVTVDGKVVEQDYSDYVTVDAKGKVTAKLACTATITATPEAHVSDYNTDNDVTFTVTVDPVLSKVTVASAKVTGYAGYTVVNISNFLEGTAVQMVGVPAGKTWKDYCKVTYATKAKDTVASLDETTGVLTCNGKGSAAVTVTVTCGTQKKTATVTVSIVMPKQLYFNSDYDNTGFYFGWGVTTGELTGIRFYTDKKDSSIVEGDVISLPEVSCCGLTYEGDNTWTWTSSAQPGDLDEYKISCEVNGVIYETSLPVD